MWHKHFRQIAKKFLFRKFRKAGIMHFSFHLRGCTIFSFWLRPRGGGGRVWGTGWVMSSDGKTDMFCIYSSPYRPLNQPCWIPPATAAIFFAMITCTEWVCLALAACLWACMCPSWPRALYGMKRPPGPGPGYSWMLCEVESLAKTLQQDERKRKEATGKNMNDD